MIHIKCFEQFQTEWLRLISSHSVSSNEMREQVPFLIISLWYYISTLNIPLYHGGLLKYCKLPLLSEVALFSPTATSCSWHLSLIWESLSMTIELHALTVASAVEHLSKQCLSEEDSVWMKASMMFTVLTSHFGDFFWISSVVALKTRSNTGFYSGLLIDCFKSIEYFQLWFWSKEILSC